MNALNAKKNGFSNFYCLQRYLYTIYINTNKINTFKMNLTELNKKYDKYLNLNYDSKETIKNYKNCFNKFKEENSRIYRMSNDDLKDYFIGFNNRYSISYYNQMLSSIRIIFKILKQPLKLKGIIYKKDHHKEVVILSIDEIKNSLKEIRNIKHRCIINLLYIGALRISELQNIEINDIDSKNNKIRIKKGKGGKGRSIPICDADISELREYYKSYKPFRYLFESTIKGKKYSQTSIRNVVKKIKTNKRVYPHLLRHTSLTNQIDKGHNHLKIMPYSGHKSSKSLQRYYHLSDSALQDMTISLKDVS